MLSITHLNTSRSLRLIVPIVVILALLCAFYADWKPIHKVIPDPNPSSGAIAIGDSGLAPPPHIPDDPSPSKSKFHYSNTNTSISNIPDKVWHSAKTDDLSENQRQRVNSWSRTTPACRQELLTDRSGEAFVRAYYEETRPDIVEVIETLSIPILRADLLRYLIVLAEGGYWSDLDVTLEKPLSDWVPLEYKDQNIDMIVGLEFDFTYRGPEAKIASQFCNWVFAAQASSRNLLVIVNAVINKLKEIALANSVSIAGITLDMFKDVVDVTGPKIMTIAILESLGQLLDRTVDDRDFSGIKHPKLVGDVLIMPGVSFAATQNRYPTDQGDALVTHHYEGSWKQAVAEAKERKKQKEQEEQSHQG
jgi:mannosyltransferase OCH1-like enzyme